MRRIKASAKTLVIAVLVGIIALGAGMAVAHNDGTEIRITAMRHESDGRIEFAVQERDGEGWGERVLPRARFFPASGREGRWLSSTPITVGEVDSLEPATATPTATSTPTATATPAATSTATTDLVVSDFEWAATSYAYIGGLRDVTAFATVTNNTGQTLTEWSGVMACFDDENVKVAEDEISAYIVIALAHGESIRLRFTDLVPSGTPTECTLSFRGELVLTTATAVPATADLLVTNFTWQTSTSPLGGDLAASATVTNNTGQTLDEWSAEMRCSDGNVVVADDQLSAFSLTALAHGEAARVQFTDNAPRGTPTECELRFRGQLELTH